MCDSKMSKSFGIEMDDGNGGMVIGQLIFEEVTIEEITEKLTATHVISFQNKKINNDHNWAGYSPSNGKYWVNGENFPTAKEAAIEMDKYGLENWTEVDQCIDDE